MKSARVHTSREPLKVEEVPKPGMPRGEEVLVRIGGTGLCHSDLHIMQGDWASSIPVQLPKTLGHEVAGWVEEVGDSVPSSSYAGGLVKGIWLPYLVVGGAELVRSARVVTSSCAILPD